ncbi:helix-turn-helix domain-containing protein [Paenibacillus xylanexedens]|uniref:helix-turn-helix domain-containing protein n=1 Tax=Paenibacillus xylanexedens TaxID=528191 RepID=UPI00142E5CE2|nr:helix-turn-helix domain-containing protein [Paenibacillus xylanexedens]
MDSNDLLDEISRRVLTNLQPHITDILSNHMNKSQDRTLDIRQAAEHLCISDKTLYTMCKQKKIPHRRLGSRITFSLSSLEAWGREQERINYRPSGGIAT